tara:strand:+ start:1224 stop:1478 length:255 start_codon:yes stop_codon:yes gene_type:complete
MSLIKKEKIDKIEVVGEYKFVQVLTALAIEDDGLELSKSYSRKTIAAGDDYSDESAEVQAICALVHTEAVVQAYAAYIDEMQDY